MTAVATDDQRIAIVGRIITMLRLASDVRLERKGRATNKKGDEVMRFNVAIEMAPDALARNKNNSHPTDLYQQNSINDNKVGSAALRKADTLIGREAYLAAGVEPPPLTKDERDALHEELKNEGIVQTAPRKRRRKKRTVRGRDACGECGGPLTDGMCVACAKAILNRDDEGLFDVG